MLLQYFDLKENYPSYLLTLLFRSFPSEGCPIYVKYL